VNRIREQYESDSSLSKKDDWLRLSRGIPGLGGKAVVTEIRYRQRAGT
jgi:hypothetical protein